MKEKYHQILQRYESSVNRFQNSKTRRFMENHRKNAICYAKKLRTLESLRRNGRIRTREQIEKRRRKRSYDLRYATIQDYPVYPSGMPCSIRCDGYFYPYEIIRSEPGRLLIQQIPEKNSPKNPPLLRIFTFRLLRRNKKGKWFGLWIEQDQSCKRWHLLNKSFHPNIFLNTDIGMSIWKTQTDTQFDWNWDATKMCWKETENKKVTKSTNHYPVPV